MAKKRHEIAVLRGYLGEEGDRMKVELRH